MLLLLTALLACRSTPETATGRPDTPPQPEDSGADTAPNPDPQPPTPTLAPLPSPAPDLDAGFGAALAFTADGDLWIGAPHGPKGGALYRLAPGKPLPAEVLRADGRLGSHLAPAPDSTLAASAPLSGAAYISDGAILSKPGTGTALAVWAGAWTLLPATLPPLTAAAARDRGDGRAVDRTRWPHRGGLGHRRGGL